MIDELENISPRRKSFDRAVVGAIDASVRFVVAHWLLLVNAVSFGYTVLPVLAPLFMHWHLDWLGRLVYAIYRPACHQLPYRSFFLFGEKWAYTAGDLQAYLNPADPSGLLGNTELGYKMAFCERDFAIYGSFFLGGVIFALVRGHLKPLPWLIYALLILPIAVDGFTQLLLFRESTWELRVITGVLFGFATVWLVYPYFEREFRKSRDAYRVPMQQPDVQQAGAGERTSEEPR